MKGLKKPHETFNLRNLTKMRFILVLLFTLAAHADWPTLKGNNKRTGFVDGKLSESFEVAWAVEFENERLGSAMEPIVADNKVFVAPHSGNLYALDAVTGEPNWRHDFRQPILHSPAAGNGLVVAAAVSGNIAVFDIHGGKKIWELLIDRSGFSASPLVEADRIYIGARGGTFYCLDLRNGKTNWLRMAGAPIRQTASVDGDIVVVGSEDMRVHGFNKKTGEVLWKSEQLFGQTFRDYYPVFIGEGVIAIQSNPLLTMGQRIGRDRTFLARNAGVDDSSWKTVDAWVKNPDSKGTPELWKRESLAISDYLATNREAQSFYVINSENGNQKAPPPILWVSGCQAVGAQPALLPDNNLLVFYRSAYGNWNHGVAPLVALGSYNHISNLVAPFIHKNGQQPPWNTFWGTADESQNFTVVGKSVVIAHQGTLSAYDLESKQLKPIFGNRDTYGGYKNPEWARNEWHGPGRGSAVFSDGKIYWITGSRVLALKPGTNKEKPQPVRVVASRVAGEKSMENPSFSQQQLSNKLATAVSEWLSEEWAPLFVDPGLAGRDFSFDETREVLEAATLAFPHLSPSLQQQLTNYVRTVIGKVSLTEGKSREWFQVPSEYRVRSGADKPAHPFGNLAALLHYTKVTEDKSLLDLSAVKKQFEDFSKWKLAGKGDLYANRYIDSLFAFNEMAKEREPALATEAQELANENLKILNEWWKLAAEGTLRTFNSSSELDPYIGRGGGLSFAVAPHRHKIALFADLTPELTERLRKENKSAIEQVWKTFNQLYTTWYLVGEERQVHTGENFVDPPDLAYNAFKAKAWLMKDKDLSGFIDIPAGKADLYYIGKLALALQN